MGCSVVTTVLDMEVQQRMDEAIALVDGAIALLLGDTGPDADNLMFATGRGFTVRHLLEKAGAQLREPSEFESSAAGLLQRAADVLDAIPADQRPTRLLPARAELSVLLVEVAESIKNA